MNSPAVTAPARMQSIAMFCVFLSMTMGRLKAGAALTSVGSGIWYHSLNKAPFNPPDWVFAPVWTCLYVMMAVAAWRVWCRVDATGRRMALLLFTLQLSLNLYWSLLFFELQLVSLAMAELLVLLTVISYTWVRFRAIDRMAGWLFLPYVIWVVFAGLLNGAILALN